MITLHRFKGMICPNMALTFEDSRRIAAKKSIYMVEYLRARREYVNPLSNPRKRYARAKYLEDLFGVKQ